MIMKKKKKCVLCARLIEGCFDCHSSTACATCSSFYKKSGDKCVAKTRSELFETFGPWLLMCFICFCGCVCVPNRVVICEKCEEYCNVGSLLFRRNLEDLREIEWKNRIKSLTKNWKRKKIGVEEIEEKEKKHNLMTLSFEGYEHSGIKPQIGIVSDRQYTNLKKKLK